MGKQLEFNFEENNLIENLIKASEMISKDLENRNERTMVVSPQMKKIFEEKYLINKSIYEENPCKQIYLEDYRESMLGRVYETFEKY